ncbi:LexA family protein [Streptomyces sp. NPDC001978]|uniref:LexA family protein n=1 Tax=Streptomyces sp. NPDC001978 TaxID=3364627 RepID=UPI0036B9EE47
MARYRVEHLTERQERIVRYIRECIADTGEAPTVVEIGEHVGLSSRSAVHYQLRQCEQKGAIVVEPRRARGIRLAR